jgi:hypothetical protein
MLLNLTPRDVAIDTLPAHVAVEESARDVVARGLQRVPKLRPVARAPRGALQEVGGDEGVCGREVENEGES